MRAGEAVADVRRLGLRPAVERVEESEPEMHGLVASQTPEAGSDVQLGSAVALYIAVPDVSSSAASLPSSLPSHGLPVDGGLEEAEEELESAEDFDVEDWWVGEGSYADDTIEIHEFAPAEETGEPWEPGPDESDGYDEDWLLEAEDFERGVWDEPPGAGRVKRWSIADEWEAGPLRVWWRSLSRPVRWFGPILAAVIVCLALVLLAGGARPTAHHHAAPRLAARPAAEGGPSAESPQNPVAPSHRPFRAARPGHKRLDAGACESHAGRVAVRRPNPAGAPAPSPAPAAVPVSASVSAARSVSVRTPTVVVREAPVSAAAPEEAADREFSQP
jgi:hypothetical protein